MTRQDYDQITSYLECITIGKVEGLERLAIISSMKRFLIDYIDNEYEPLEYIARLETEKAELQQKLQAKTDYCNILKGLVNKELLQSLDRIAETKAE